MVSFQCHSCNDVVKKPKLDQHHGRCHAGFDCIDCSATFNTPAQYKSHTSCISEAEKYQKGLYKGPKKGQEDGDDANAYANENGNPNGHRNERGGFRGRGRGVGRGGVQGRGGYQGGRPPRKEGTGANDTPLGSPPRMSPVTIESDPKVKNANTDAPAPVSLPSQHVAPTLTSSPTKNAEGEPDSSAKPKKKQQGEKKSTSKSKKSNEEAEANEPMAVENMSTVPPPPIKKAIDAIEKKKRKKAEVQAPAAEQTEVHIKEQGKTKDLAKEKKKKKKKESKGDESVADKKTDSNSQVEHADPKEEQTQEKCVDAVPRVQEDTSKRGSDEREKDTGSKEKKRKKSKNTVPEEETPEATPKPPPVEKVESKEGKEKKKKRGPESISAEPAKTTTAPVQNEGPEKKLKKRKVDDGDVKELEGDLKKKKKSTKRDLSGADVTPAVSAKPSGKKRKREGNDDTKDGTDKPTKKEKEKKKKKNQEMS